MPVAPVRVLLICGDPAEAGLLRSLFGFVPDFQVSLTEAANLRETEYALATRQFDLIILSADMDGGNAFSWLDELVRGQFAPVLVLEENATIRRAVEAIRKGALDYYPKSDISPRILGSVLAQAVRERPKRARQVTGPAKAVPPNQLSADRILRRGLMAAGDVDEARRRAGSSRGSLHSSPAPDSAPSASSPADARAVDREQMEEPSGSVSYPVAEEPRAGAMLRTAPDASGEVRSAQASVGGPASPGTGGDLTYSTNGIDREMERLGIHRPWSVLQHVAELRSRIADLHVRIMERPSPEVFREFLDCARQIVSGIHAGFEMFSILHLDLPETENVSAARALNLCAVAICLARSCDFAEEEVVHLATAALLYRAGTENDDVASAAAVAADLAKKAGAPSNVILALEQMPERADGTGPKGLRGKQIMIDAQILLLADTLERLHFDGGRFLRSIFPQLDVSDPEITLDPMYVVVNNLRSWFQPRVLKALITANGFFSVGTIVQLNNGAVARVVAPNVNRPTQPVVEVIRTSFGDSPSRVTRIDLSRSPGIAIRRVLSYNPAGSG